MFNIDKIDLAAIRDWAQLTFIFIGGTIGLIAFFQNIRQRRLENALKMVGAFREALRKNDISNWGQLFHMASEPAGAKPGHYVSSDGKQCSIAAYFAEGSPDQGSTARMAENLEIICYEIYRKTVDPRIVWFELGQLLRTMHYWLSNIPSYQTGKSFLKTSFPSIDHIFKKYSKRFATWPCRTHSYVE